MQVTSNVVAHPSASLAPQDFGVQIIEARPPNWLYDPNWLIGSYWER